MSHSLSFVIPFNPAAVDTTPVLGKTSLLYQTKFVNV
ncbi:MAG: hypothetical protein QOH63_4038 [Acidobacteriota bacterium]|jgi:hypothetical protein|nr:hypothetical protein [Acidobacteriota bacterium]